MASTNELVYSILEKLRPNISSMDDVDLRLIKSELHKQRALFIRNELNRARTVDPFIIQDLGCVEIEVVDRAECCDITIDCSILRTSLKVPSTIELHNSITLWVNPIDKIEKSFSFIDYERAKFIKGHRFTSNQIFAFILNNYIYLISEDDSHSQISHISIRGVFENPEEAAKFNTCDGDACYSDDAPYPLKSWMANYVEGEVYNRLLSKLKNPKDESNDSKGNPIPVI